MKYLPPLAVLFFCSCTQLIAQSQIRYSSPEPKGYEPVMMNSQDAKSEASAQSSSCGYSSGFFGKSDIENLMGVNNCVGIRIYNAKVSSSQANCDIVAVAVDENGKEIGPTMGKKYLHATSFDNDAGCASTKLSKSNAKSYVSNVANSGSIEYQKVFFSKATINERLAVRESTGINVIPGSLQGEKTMMISAAKLDGGKLTDLGDTYMKSKLPCPTDCGDTGNYLVEPK